MAELVPAELIQQRILVIRGKRVLLDADLARFYGVGTRELNRAVSRNTDRFPEDFAFKLTLEETRALMFQIGTSKPAREAPENRDGFHRMVSVLRSDRAVAVSVAIVRRSFACVR